MATREITRRTILSATVATAALAAPAALAGVALSSSDVAAAITAVEEPEPLIALYAKWQLAEVEHTAAIELADEAAGPFFAARERGSPDAEMLERAYAEKYEASRDAGSDAWDVLEEIIEAEAQGPRGTLIKLRTAAAFARDERGEDSEDISDRFIFALLDAAERLVGGAS